MNLVAKLTHSVTYWPVTGQDGYGATTFGIPQLLNARWEEHVENVLGKDGEEFVSKARVYFDQDIDINGYLYLGESSEDDPQELADAFEIRAKTRMPDLRAIQELVVAYL